MTQEQAERLIGYVRGIGGTLMLILLALGMIAGAIIGHV